MLFPSFRDTWDGGNWQQVQEGSAFVRGRRGAHTHKKKGQALFEQGCCREGCMLPNNSCPATSGSRRVELGDWKGLTLRSMGKDISGVWPGLQDASGHCTPTLVTMASPPRWESWLFSGRSWQ